LKLAAKENMLPNSWYLILFTVNQITYSLEVRRWHLLPLRLLYRIQQMFWGRWKTFAVVHKTRYLLEKFCNASGWDHQYLLYTANDSMGNFCDWLKSLKSFSLKIIVYNILGGQCIMLPIALQYHSATNKWRSADF